MLMHSCYEDAPGQTNCASATLERAVSLSLYADMRARSRSFTRYNQEELLESNGDAAQRVQDSLFRDTPMNADE